MPLYRFYFATSQARITGPAVEAECANDERALAKAAEIGRKPEGHGTQVEVWDRARFIGKVPSRI